MTDTTRDIPLTNAWSQISVDGASECALTLEGNRANTALVRIAASAPAASVVTGHRLSPLTPSMYVQNIVEGCKVWARAVHEQALICTS